MVTLDEYAATVDGWIAARAAEPGDPFPCHCPIPVTARVWGWEDDLPRGTGRPFRVPRKICGHLPAFGPDWPEE